VQFTGAAWPIPLLAIWRPFAVRSWQRRIAFVLLFVAVVDASLIDSAGSFTSTSAPHEPDSICAPDRNGRTLTWNI
jgi:hypothetical protein